MFREIGVSGERVQKTKGAKGQLKKDKGSKTAETKLDIHNGKLCSKNC